jgi:hypothetical protein
MALVCFGLCACVRSGNNTPTQSEAASDADVSAETKEGFLRTIMISFNLSGEGFLSASALKRAQAMPRQISLTTPVPSALRRQRRDFVGKRAIWPTGAQVREFNSRST